MAGHPRTRSSVPSSASSAWRGCPIRPTWATRSRSRCVIIISKNCRLDIMITKMTGTVNRVLDDEIRLQVGPLEYQILVPEFIRRILQHKHGEELTLYTSHYLDGNPAHGRMVPRLIGFLAEAEQEFFDLFCTVDKVGVRKAMKAFGRPIKDIADAIQRQDNKWLTTLPGIGAATAEQIVATLRRKVTKFALMAPAGENGDGSAT